MRTRTRTTILVLSACMALQMTSFVMILPLFARRFQELGAGVQDLGISSMAYALASTLAAPFMGALADRFGRRPLVLVSLAAYVAAFCGYLLAPSVAAFIVIRGLAGAFTAGLIPAVTGLAADLAPKDSQAQWIGYLNAGASFGWIAGPVAGGVIFDYWGYSTAVMVSIGMAVLTLLVALLGIPASRLSFGRSVPVADENRPKATAGSLAEKASAALPNLRSTLPSSLVSFFILLFIAFAVMFAWAFIEPRFMFYAYNDLQWSSSTLGLMMGVYGVALMFGELVFGRLSDRLGRKPVILLGLVLFSAQFFGLAFFRDQMLIGVAFVIAGLGNALYDPALSAAILDISPAEHRARVLGIKSMLGSFGSILGPAAIAMLSESISARSVFLTSFGVALLTALIALAFLTKLRLPAEMPVQAPVPE